MENRGRAQKPGKIKESGKEHQGGVLVTLQELLHIGKVPLCWAYCYRLE